MLQHPYKGNRQYPYKGVHHYFYMKRSKSTTGNNTTDVRIAGSVSLPTTHTNPICPASIIIKINSAKRDWIFTV